MITQTDGSVLYTQEERDETAQAQYHAGVRMAQSSIFNAMLMAFREYVQGSTEDNDKVAMLNLYNQIADAVGYTRISTLANKFNVVVEYNGTTVAEFSDIEADDEDEAVEEVRDNLEIEDAELSLTISYNGDTCNESVQMDTWDISSELEIRAYEQD